MSGILQSASMQFTQEARLKQDAIDRTNELITQLSSQQKLEQQKLELLRERLRLRHDRTKRIANLKRWLEPQRHMLSVNAGATDLHEKRRIGYADAEGVGVIVNDEDLPFELRQASEHIIRQASTFVFRLHHKPQRTAPELLRSFAVPYIAYLTSLELPTPTALRLRLLEAVPPRPTCRRS